MKRLLAIGIVLGLFIGCGDEEKPLPSVEERVSEAVGNLTDLLTAPANGWKTYYKPTSQAGSFLMILDFNTDGTVKISTDVPFEDGAYLEQTIPYRVDAGRGLELVFETYGVFHYLFELDQASFGAEFEFIYDEQVNDNLLFHSKSDFSDISVFLLQPASATDKALLSPSVAANFDLFTGQSPILFGGVDPTQQLYLSGLDLSIFWTVDLDKRTADFDIAGKGSDISSIVSGGYTELNAFRGFTFQDGKMVFNSPVSIEAAGKSITLTEITMGSFSETGDPLCPGGENTPKYEVGVADAGTGLLTKNLFNSSGLGFEKQADTYYSVNVLYVLDDSLNSLSVDGSIAELLPNALGFMMTFGMENDSIPANSAGFIVEGEEGYGEFYLRALDISSVGNAFSISLKDEYYFSQTATAQDSLAMQTITDEIFEGGVVYAFDLPIDGITVFQFYNPCNEYEFVLVK